MITRRAATVGLATALFGLSRWGEAQSAVSPAPVEDMPSEITAKSSRKRLRPNAEADADILTLNGRLAPTFRLRAGAPLEFTFKNETALPLSLHIQGLRGPNAMDGVGRLTQESVQPGGRFAFRLPPPDPGTFLIRPCILGGSAEPLGRGLSAMLIVEESAAPTVDLDCPLLIDDWRLNDDGSLTQFLKASNEAPVGRLGNLLTVNGVPAPQRIEAPAGGRLRIRLANTSNARAMRLQLSDLKSVVIAIDGQPTETFEPLRSSLPFAPGSRYDLLVDLPAQPGARGAILAMLGEGIPLVEIITKGEPQVDRPPIGPLAPNDKLPKAIALEKATRKELTIQNVADNPTSGWTINGAPGDPSTPALKIRRGTPVVLTLNNKTPFVQPFHLHGHVFRLLHGLDDGWQPYFLDTVQVPENKTSRIAFVADNPGKWLLESTVMERFDAGLWTWIEVS
ncbi:multicopper oxidase family protein [Microvirga puerhi]|uniref:Multicopper oxidase family protein n=1 Tax=Microvirga puerhi TaxID=2876078 RepID=A0ABS7VHH2_9HYPH|nr:multicopper oxidase family protein [Microvirga puerhi]MBZ6074954.1 multicopper oxidase family protein [Microvirga puerhi]